MDFLHHFGLHHLQTKTSFLQMCASAFRNGFLLAVFKTSIESCLHRKMNPIKQSKLVVDVYGSKTLWDPSCWTGTSKPQKVASIVTPIILLLILPFILFWGSCATVDSYPNKFYCLEVFFFCIGNWYNFNLNASFVWWTDKTNLNISNSTHDWNYLKQTYFVRI